METDVGTSDFSSKWISVFLQFLRSNTMTFYGKGIWSVWFVLARKNFDVSTFASSDLCFGDERWAY